MVACSPGIRSKCASERIASSPKPVWLVSTGSHDGAPNGAMQRTRCAGR